MLELRDFYFIRHGETDWNREHRGMGQKDIPLNERGLEQAHKAATVLVKEPIQTICFSPLMRARVTAEIIGEKLNVPLVEIPGLIECSWGENEGKIKGKWTDDWVRGTEIPGAENYQEFLRRAVAAINRATKENGPVLIVAHGGVFWALQHFGKLGSKMDLPNGAPVYLRAPLSETSPWAYSRIDGLLFD